MTDRQVNDCAGLSARFRDLSVKADGRYLLENICAVVPAGSATVLIGPNGAGKTTLLKCLLGEMSYTGQIEFSCGQARVRPVIGYVPQELRAERGLPLRVYEFLALHGNPRPLWLGCSRRKRARARELLALVGAEKLETHKLGELSGGETRRVLLAAALGRKPDLLVLDEAEAGVDFKGERLFWQLLEKSRAELGFTLIMVSHNLPLAAHYATHVICIKTSLVVEGSPREALTSENLCSLFGVPIHLYPYQCEDRAPICKSCGAFEIFPGTAGGAPHEEKNGSASANSLKAPEGPNAGK